jgi:hypothetical protein
MFTIAFKKIDPVVDLSVVYQDGLKNLNVIVKKKIRYYIYIFFSVEPTCIYVNVLIRD